MRMNKMYVPAIFEPECYYYCDDDDDDESEAIEVEYCDGIETAIDEVAEEVSTKGIDVDKIKGNLFISGGTVNFLIGKKPIEVNLNITEYAPLSKKKLIAAIKASSHYKPNIVLQNLKSRRKELRDELDTIEEKLEKFGIYD